MPKHFNPDASRATHPNERRPGDGRISVGHGSLNRTSTCSRAECHQEVAGDQPWLGARAFEGKVDLPVTRILEMTSVGGKFAGPMGENLNRMTFDTAVIRIDGSSHIFEAADGGATTPTTQDGRSIKVNLCRSTTGWRWAQDVPGQSSLVISLETMARHIYALQVSFQAFTAGRSQTFPNAPSEPRLRPVTYDVVQLGERAAIIIFRGREHPVYAELTVTRTSEVDAVALAVFKSTGATAFPTESYRGQEGQVTTC
jgi:hypothetical protein